MAKASKGILSTKQKTQAKKIAKGAKQIGKTIKRATASAWASVNKSSGTTKKRSAGGAKKAGKAPARKGAAKSGRKSTASRRK